MRITVFPADKFVIESWINLSVLVSNEAVASSKINILGFNNMALAIEILWRSPPLKFIFPSPIKVSYPFSRLIIKSWACDNLAASITSS